MDDVKSDILGVCVWVYEYIYVLCICHCAYDAQVKCTNVICLSNAHLSSCRTPDFCSRLRTISIPRIVIRVVDRRQLVASSLLLSCGVNVIMHACTSKY